MVKIWVSKNVNYAKKRKLNENRDKLKNFAEIWEYAICIIDLGDGRP